MLLVYVEQISPRISYALDFVFSARGQDYQLTTDVSVLTSNSKVLSYTKEEVGAHWIPQASLITSEKIDKPTIEIGLFGSEECYSFEGVIDPIASVFYLLTRYEEYVTIQWDEHGRFPFSQSNLPDSWVELAKCDRWAGEIMTFLGLDPMPLTSSPQLVPTFDIDNSYAYLLKKGKRRILSTLKDLVNFNFAGMKLRRAVLRGAHDPYDTYEKIREVAKRYPASKMFWLIGKWGEYDRNISIKNKGHQELIRQMKSAGLSIGLHPSYRSFHRPNVISSEKEQLESVLDAPIYNSRQHYLRSSLPLSYVVLDELGFKHEYSMGFAERVGFRCGTSRPHYWFNLSKNKQTELMIHPFVYMDGTLREYMKLTISESKQKISQLYAELERFGGNYVFIWHNETIGDHGNWKGWSEVLDHTLNLQHESN
ncbi:MAG: hypothetical protein ACI837_002803 [Crocinitomicaceae bacterium]|jgi:hypothetical protein